MKTITKLFLLSALLLVFSACEKDPLITLNSSSQIEVPSEGGSATISFSANRDWKASSAQGWIRVSPSSGTKTDGNVSVTITCDANSEYDERTGTVTISIEGMSQSVSVKQPARQGLFVPTQSFEVSAGATSIEVQVQANVEYEVSSSAGWIKQTGTKALSSTTFVFSIEENPDHEEREATITVKAKGAASLSDQIVRVRQAGQPYEEDDVEPGVSGIQGITWMYRSGQDQMLYRKSGSNAYCILMEPSANKVFCITLPLKDKYTAGMEFEATVTQNVDKDKPAIAKMKMKVSQTGGRYLFLSDENGKTAVLIVG